MYVEPVSKLIKFKCFDQKRDSSLGPLTSTSDKSSGIKSNSTPSTPQAGSSNFQAESTHSQSPLTETSPPADILSEARQDREVPEDSFLGQETPLVLEILFSYSSLKYILQRQDYQLFVCILLI